MAYNALVYWNVVKLVIFLVSWHCGLPIGPLKNAADANWLPIGADRFEEVNITIGEQLKSFLPIGANWHGAPIGKIANLPT